MKWNMVLGQLPPRKIAPNPKLTLAQTLTLSGGQFSLEAIVWLPPNWKTKPNLDPNPKLQTAIFFGGQLSGYRACLWNIFASTWITNYLFIVFLVHRRKWVEPYGGQSWTWEGLYVTIGNQAFCLFLYLTGVHFRGEL